MSVVHFMHKAPSAWTWMTVLFANEQEQATVGGVVEEGQLHGEGEDVEEEEEEEEERAVLR